MRLCCLLLVAALASVSYGQDSLYKVQQTKSIYKTPAIDTIIITKLRFYEADSTETFAASTKTPTKRKIRINKALYTSFYYPKPPRRVGMEGKASCSFRFDAKGNMDKKEIIEESYDFFGEALMVALYDERFFTFKAKKNSNVRLWGEMEVEWRLKKE